MTFRIYKTVSVLIVLNIIFCSVCLGNTESRVGVIEKRGWTKSNESYLAGGSEYYVLKEGTTSLTRNTSGGSEKKVFEKRIILRESTDIKYSDINVYVDKKVILEGEFVDEDIKKRMSIDDSNFSQRPSDISIPPRIKEEYFRNKKGSKENQKKKQQTWFKVYNIEVIGK